MPLFAAGADVDVSKASDEKREEYVGQIDPQTMLTIIRVQNEQKKKNEDDRKVKKANFLNM